MGKHTRMQKKIPLEAQMNVDAIVAEAELQEWEKRKKEEEINEGNLVYRTARNHMSLNKTQKLNSI